MTELAAELPQAEPMMDVNHVANAVLQMAKLPLEANVQFMTILATKMPYIGRGMSLLTGTCGGGFANRAHVSSPHC